MEWRLFLDPPAAGAWNMAVDEALAEAVHAGTSPPVLRLYRWWPPCLSLGASQPFAVADHAFCAAHGVEVVRRPTGGRAVLHQHELTYLVAAPLAPPLFPRELQQVYRLVCRALVEGLRLLGVDAQLAAPVAAGELIRPTQAIPCFVGPAPGEVVVGGRKLVGSAMRRVGEAVLQHGSILEDWDGALQAGCLGLANDAPLRASVVTLREILGFLPPHQRLVERLSSGFSQVFGSTLRPSTLTAAERQRVTQLVKQRYAAPQWTEERRRGEGNAILTSPA